MKKLEFAVKSSGGDIRMLDKDTVRLSEILSDQNSCIIRPSANECQDDFFVTLSLKLDR